MFAVLEPHVLEASAPIQTPVDAVAIAHVPAAHIFPSAHPDGVAVGRINGHTAQGVRAIVVEDRLEGGTGIGGLPEVARSCSHIPRIGRLRVYCDVCDASRHQGRSNAAKGNAGQQAAVESGRVGFGVIGLCPRAGAQACYHHQCHCSTPHRFLLQRVFTNWSNRSSVWHDPESRIPRVYPCPLQVSPGPGQPPAAGVHAIA